MTEAALQLLSEHIWCQVQTPADSASFAPAGGVPASEHPRFLNVGLRLPTSGYSAALSVTGRFGSRSLDTCFLDALFSGTER